MTEPQRILLGPSASQALTSAGANVFVVIGRASWPEDPSRWIMHLVPCSSIKVANDAVAVAQGQATARRIKTPPISHDASQAVPIPRNDHASD